MIDIDYYLSKLCENTFSIFLFHGVIEDINTGIRNYTRKHLLAEEFEILIKRLKVKGNPISMDDVIWHYENEKILPPYSYAITFDDGFENNPYLDAVQAVADKEGAVVVAVCAEIEGELNQKILSIEEGATLKIKTETYK